MRSDLRPCLLGVLGLLSAACVVEDQGVPEGKLARVGNELLDSQDVAEVGAQLGEYAQLRFSGDEGQRTLLESIVVAEMLAQEARDAGMSADPRVEFALFEEIASVYLTSELERAVPYASIAQDQDALREYYDAHLDEFTLPERRSMRGVMVPRVDEGEDALARLRRNETKLEELGDVVGTPLQARDDRENPTFHPYLFAPGLSVGDPLPHAVVLAETVIVGEVEKIEPPRVEPFDDPRRPRALGPRRASANAGPGPRGAVGPPTRKIPVASCPQIVVGAGGSWYPVEVNLVRAVRWLGAVGLAAALWGGPTATQAAPSSTRVQLDKIVAVVGDDIILRSELDRTTRNHPLYLEAMAQVPAAASDEVKAAKTRDVESKILDELIDLALFKAEAVKFDIRVTPKDIERATMDVARQYGLSVEELRAQVEASDEYGSWAEYQGELRDQILQFKVPHYLATWSVSEAQVREHYRKLTRDESAKVRVVQFPFSPQSQESAERDKAFARAQSLGRRLRNGEDAKKLSEASATAGYEKTIGRGDIAPALEDAIFEAKDGQVVGPIASGQAYLVFKVLEHLESAALSYEQAKGRIREQLESEAFFKAQAELKQQLRAKAHIDIRL